MFRIILSLFIILTVFSCNVRNSRNKQDLEGSPEITGFKDSTTVQIIDSVYNFGKIVEGDKVEYKFHFRNTGKNPLIVTKAFASCGCTVPEKPDAPIQPGQVGFLNVVFNSAGKMGQILKEVTVISNAYPVFPKLLLKGEVITKDQNK